MEAIDPSFYQNLTWILESDDVEVLDLNFSVDMDILGTVQSVPLKAGGDTITVTNANKKEYLPKKIGEVSFIL